MSKIRVLVVDDSAVIRGILTRILEKDGEIEIVGSAANGEIGVSLYEREKPDIVILDVEMPVMDGLAALEKIIALDKKAKVIMCSTLTHKNADTTIQAMKIGAVDYIPKPTSAHDVNNSDDFHDQLLRLVKGIHNPSAASSSSRSGGATSSSRDVAVDFTLRDKPSMLWKPKVIAIGSSTGGPQALFELMKGLKDINLPIVITQHMPATFTTLLAQHIDQQTGIPCTEGADGLVLEPNKALLAPGGKHMIFVKDGMDTKVQLSDGPAENFCKPAVDPMMRSLVDVYGGDVMAVILTGMGNDGQSGVEGVVEQGGFCVAQDQETSVVWGMPGAVANAGLCSAVLPIKDIASWVKQHGKK